MFLPPGSRIESLPGLSVAALVERHVVRVETARASSPIAEHSKLQTALESCAAGVARVRSLFRSRQWVVPTANPHLDRFTLRGAFTLTHNALTSARRRVAVPASTAAASERSLASDDLTFLRVEADLQVVLDAAEHPEAVPGTPWPLLAVIAGTAILSFVAMAALWDMYFAALILAVITFHEAGHALAMRQFGYRDVHVFFVPLLGAMTIGRPTVTTVRDRLAVLLAGPVPGLFLAVVLLAIEQTYGPAPMLRRAGLALFILNALNLLPFTPLDGGRVLEALTRPESIWRLIVHGLSAAGLLAVAAVLRDPIIAVLGALWVAMLPRSWATYKLRSTIAARVHDREDFRSVARAALEVMTTPPYAKWRAVTRVVTARAIARLFAESVATPADRRWGAVAYASAWIPVIAAILLLRS
jgi:Zn-dependent protease